MSNNLMIILLCIILAIVIIILGLLIYEIFFHSTGSGLGITNPTPPPTTRHHTSLFLFPITDVSGGTTVTAIGNLTDTDSNVGINNEPITFTDNGTNSVLSSINTQGITITDPSGINVVQCPTPACTPISGSSINIIRIHSGSEISFPPGTIGATFYLQNMNDNGFTVLVTQNNGVKYTASGKAYHDYVTAFTAMGNPGIEKIDIFQLSGPDVGITEIKTINPDSEPKTLLDGGFEAIAPGTYPMVQFLNGSYSAVAQSPTAPVPGVITVQAHFAGDANYFPADSNAVVYNTAAPTLGVSGSTETPTMSETGTVYTSILCSAASPDSHGDHICDRWITTGIPYNVGSQQFLYPLPNPYTQYHKAIFVRDVQAQQVAQQMGNALNTVINGTANPQTQVAAVFASAHLVPPACHQTPCNPDGIGLEMDGMVLPAGSVDKAIHLWTDLDTSQTDDFDSIKAKYFGDQNESLSVTGPPNNSIPSGLTFNTLGLTITTPFAKVGNNPPTGSTCGQYISGNITINQIVTFNGAVTIQTPIANPTYSGISTTTTQSPSAHCGILTTINWNAISAAVTTNSQKLNGPVQNITLTVPFTTNGNVTSLTVPTITTTLQLSSGGGNTIQTVQQGANTPTIDDSLLGAKAQAYHFVLFADCINDCGSTPTGMAEQKGNDFAIALGPDNPIMPSSETLKEHYYAGTFMHELGHNLDLKHGGPVKTYTVSHPTGTSTSDAATNCKPNYPSVMSYARQLDTDLYDSGGVDRWVLNYSGGLFSSLTESNLHESNSLSYSGNQIPWIVWTNNTSALSYADNSLAALDWDNEDNTPTAGGHGGHAEVDSESAQLSVNINNFGIRDCQYTNPITLYDHNDWNNLFYNFTWAGTFRGVHSNPAHLAEITVPIYYEMLAQAHSPKSPVETKLVNITLFSGADSHCAISNTCFDPSYARVSVGDTVIWNNNDTVGHTVTSGRPSDQQTGAVFDSGLIHAGASFSFTFNQGGDYYYFDQVHPWMIGRVHVSET